MKGEMILLLWGVKAIMCVHLPVGIVWVSNDKHWEGDWRKPRGLMGVLWGAELLLAEKMEESHFLSWFFFFF